MQPDLGTSVELHLRYSKVCILTIDVLEMEDRHKVRQLRGFCEEGLQKD